MPVEFSNLRVGVVGVGIISDMYLRCITRSPMLELVALAATTAERAQPKADEFGVKAVSFAEMIADPAIDLIVNLTPAQHHEELNEAVLRAGKHLYSEKPFALAPGNMAMLQEIAAHSGSQWSSAPDTYLGGGHQAARRALDEGRIGTPVFGVGFVGHPGVEGFHPSPRQFYERGGEMPLDVGPYHVAQWINLLGPVRKVYCSARRGRDERVIQRGPLAGTVFPVEVDTSFCIMLDFEGASVSLVLSLDVSDPSVRPSQLFGTHGVMTLPDPHFFGGDVRIGRAGAPPEIIESKDLPFGAPNMMSYRGDMVANYRGAGLIDLAMSISTGGARHIMPAFVAHMVEVMDAILTSASRREAISIISSCERPLAMGSMASDEQLIALTPSPHASSSKPVHDLVASD